VPTATAASDAPVPDAGSSRTTAFPVTRSATQTSTVPSVDGTRRTAAAAPTFRAACSSGVRDTELPSGGRMTMTSTPSAASSARTRRVNADAGSGVTIATRVAPVSADAA